MYISSQNWICEDGCAVASDTLSCVGQDYQLLPYNGVPVRLFAASGSLAYDLAGVRDISAIGLMTVRYYRASGSNFSLSVQVRNGGAAGTIVFDDSFTFQNDTLFDIYESQAVIIPKVQGDYVKLTYNGVSNKLLMINRIWVGTHTQLDNVNQYSHLIIDNTVVEMASTGAATFNERSINRVLNISSAEIHDNLAGEDAAENTDLESLFKALSRVGMNRELLILPSDGFDAFHGRLSSVPTIKKSNGVIYTSNLQFKEF